ncbi:hypothetical protein [Actinokineospora xionganensis]|uniref:Uncharacterized protein n=1 Tax=Actinokineospora xionganensis TaxID=2684470 RepID=A0ABR7LA85_9PSEU|nr:hypothetical protein [Actinokineospora xionganensis]MBC6449626.1 hypothetical protein [Actinokineospora xionganensis]
MLPREAKLSNIEIFEADFERIKLLQRAWNGSAATVVNRLLDSFMREQPHVPEGEPADPGEIRVHATYEGVWIDGLFEPVTERLLITNGDLAGQRFKSPSGAAAAVVRLLNPDVHPNRNGWTFWTVTDTGHLLGSLRRHDSAGRAG